MVFTKWVGAAGSKTRYVYAIHNPTKCVLGIFDNVADAREAEKTFENMPYELVEYSTEDVAGWNIKPEFEVRGTLESYVITLYGLWGFPYSVLRWKFSGTCVKFSGDNFVKHCWVFLKEG